MPFSSLPSPLFFRTQPDPPKIAENKQARKEWGGNIKIALFGRWPVVHHRQPHSLDFLLGVCVGKHFCNAQTAAARKRGEGMEKCHRATFAIKAAKKKGGERAVSREGGEGDKFGLASSSSFRVPPWKHMNFWSGEQHITGPFSSPLFSAPSNRDSHQHTTNGSVPGEKERRGEKGWSEIARKKLICMREEGRGGKG